MGAAVMAVTGTFPQSFCLAVVQEPFCTKDLVGRGSPTVKKGQIKTKNCPKHPLRPPMWRWHHSLLPWEEVFHHVIEGDGSLRTAPPLRAHSDPQGQR